MYKNIYKRVSPSHKLVRKPHEHPSTIVVSTINFFRIQPTIRQLSYGDPSCCGLLSAARWFSKQPAAMDEAQAWVTTVS